VNAEADGDALVGGTELVPVLGSGEVATLALGVGATFVLALPSGPLKAYEMIKTTMASPTRTTPRRR